jgi:hypothetical protein
MIHLNRFFISICQLALLAIVSCNHTPTAGDCKKFHNGKFRVLYEDEGKAGIFTMEGNRQIYVTEGKNDTSVFAVRRMSDCTYELHYLSGKVVLPDSIDKYYRTHPSKVNIIETSENYFLFTTEVEGVGILINDTAFRLN